MAKATGDFDPYHKWLGIPKSRRPPTYYDLLAISLNEDDHDVIRSAAEQRRAFVDSQRGGAHGNAVNGVLYQIQEAELILLDSALREEYDSKLKLRSQSKKKRKAGSVAAQSRPGQIVGEGNEIVRTFVGIMAVLLVGVGLMAWFSFQMLWDKPPAADENVAGAAVVSPAPIEQQLDPPEQGPEPEAEPEMPAPQIAKVPDSEPMPEVSEPLPAVAVDDGAVDDGFESLFDGKSFTGWRLYHGGPIRQGWVVENEMLCSKGKGKAIITERQFADFELEFEWKVAKGSNGGVAYRVSTGDPKPWDSGIEYQILDNTNHAEGQRPITSAASIYGIVGTTSVPLNPLSEFNTARIVVQGGHVEHWMNGEKTVDIEMHSPQWKKRVARTKTSKWPKKSQFAKANTGHICLFHHGNDVCYRNIRIRSITGSLVNQ